MRASKDRCQFQSTSKPRGFPVLLPLLLCLCLNACPLLLFAASSTQPQISKKEIEKLIKEAGSTKPDWWDATPMNYPANLDMSKPREDKSKWNARVNATDYIVDNIYPNPRRWHEGLKMLHLIRSQNDKNKAVLAETNDILARAYRDYEGDWARAAFYELEGNPKAATVSLANCYFRMGNKDMAMDIVGKEKIDLSRYGETIQLLADMGEFKKALSMAEERAARTNNGKDIAWLAAGDVARMMGNTDAAIDYYKRCLKLTKAESGRDYTQTLARAQASLDAVQMIDQFDVGKCKDGTYSDKSVGYSGDVNVSVTVAQQKITEIKIGQHKEKRYFMSLTEIPQSIIDKQSVKGIDATMGATITAEAVVNAVTKALYKAR